MGTNDVNFPTNVRSDEEAIAYLGAMVNAIKNNTLTQLSGAGPFTITALQMSGGVIEFNGSTTAVTVTTDTAVNIVARMQALDANAGVGSTMQLTLINDNTSSGAITLGGSTGVTLAGPTPTALAIATAKRYLIKIVTLTTVTMMAMA